MGPRRHSWDLVFRHAPRRFTPKHVLKWLRCVARKNVKRLSLNYSYEMETPPCSLFSCTRLTVLKLKTCILTTFPTDFFGFRRLTKCTLRHTTMTDDSLARLLSHCPLLRKFKFMDCVGLQNPVISALNLRDLALQFHKPQPLTVNCPKLRTLKANMSVKDLRLNGLKFHEISPMIETLQMGSGSNLIELRLHSRMRYNFSVSRFLELVGTLRSLKVLVFHLGNEDREAKVFPKVVPFFNLVSRLPNLERLHLHGKLILHEMGRYKNLLQEYTQKRSLPLPNYRCEGSGKLHSPTYVCTVEVSGIEYTGGAANTKKEAQTNAARVALQALEAQADDSVSQGTVPNIFPSQGVGSVVLTSPVEAPPRKRDRGVQSVSEENETAKTKQKITASNSMQIENVQGMPTVGDPQSAPVKESEKHAQTESSQMQQDRVKVEGEVALQAGEEGSEKLQHHEECNPLLRLT